MTASLVVLMMLLGADQPLPFSHKKHTEIAKLACKDCHTMADPGEVAGIPATSKCMGCHVAIKTDSPHIAKLTALHKEKKRVPWVRVYEIPGYVFFNHKQHVEAGATCATCHGAVGEKDVVTKEVQHNMGSCMDCHRRNKAPNDCMTCHDPRN